MIKVKEYSGHIRNWKKLCAELGIDSTLEREKREKEILVKAYQKWCFDMAAHIYGRFAFALWDEEEETLFCLRDQFGIFLSIRRRKVMHTVSHYLFKNRTVNFIDNFIAHTVCKQLFDRIL